MNETVRNAQRNATTIPMSTNVRGKVAVPRDPLSPAAIPGSGEANPLAPPALLARRELDVDVEEPAGGNNMATLTNGNLQTDDTLASVSGQTAAMTAPGDTTAAGDYFRRVLDEMIPVNDAGTSGLSADESREHGSALISDAVRESDTGYGVVKGSATMPSRRDDGPIDVSGKTPNLTRTRVRELCVVGKDPVQTVSPALVHVNRLYGDMSPLLPTVVCCVCNTNVYVIPMCM